MVMTQSHGLMQVHPRDDAPPEAPWERERRALAALCARINALPAAGPPVRFLDFCTFSELNIQPLPGPGEAPEFPDWPDLEHCSTRLGIRLLDRCFDPSAETITGWGVDVLQTGIEAHLENLRKGHAEYCRSRPQDVAWLRATLFPEP